MTEPGLLGDLFPRPRSVTVGAGPSLAPDAPVTTRLDRSLPPQGYTIGTDSRGVDVAYADDLGLRYGRATLDQLTGLHPGGLPQLRVHDWPDFTVRAYMLDISRDRVPTRATLERLVGLSALARINQFQLYTEHTFAFADHEIVWRDASPVTAEDVRWLDDVCAAEGIELVPNLNCFGHTARWLKHEEYRDRAEAPGGIELMEGVRSPPSVLAPTEDNARFALDLLAELLPNFRSREVNINCDETFDLGLGVSKVIVARDGKERVYLGYLQRLLGPLLADGYRVQFWADVIRSAPALAAELPAEAVPVCWTYEAPGAAMAPDIADAFRRFGVDPDTFAGFEANTGPLVDAGIPFWVAPGTSSWNSLVGRSDNATANLVDAATVGAANGSGGYVITDWGDNGHLQPPSVSFGPLVYGGAVAWCLEQNRDLDVARVLDRLVFEDATGTIGAAVMSLGCQWALTGQLAVNCSPLHTALIGRMNLVTGSPDPALIGTVVEELDRAAAAISGAPAKCMDADIVRDELVQAARLARHGAWRLLGLAGGESPGADALRADLSAAIEGQQDTWLRRSRPGGLDDSLAPLRRRLARY